MKRYLITSEEPCPICKGILQCSECGGTGVIRKEVDLVEALSDQKTLGTHEILAKITKWTTATGQYYLTNIEAQKIPEYILDNYCATYGLTRTVNPKGTLFRTVGFIEMVREKIESNSASSLSRATEESRSRWSKFFERVFG